MNILSKMLGAFMASLYLLSTKGIFLVKLNKLKKNNFLGPLHVRANLSNSGFFLSISIVHESGFRICKQNHDNPAKIRMVRHSVFASTHCSGHCKMFHHSPANYQFVIISIFVLLCQLTNFHQLI